MFAVESLGQLLMDVGIYGGGLLFGVLAIILGISRSMTKNQDHWALIFGVFAWTISLIIPTIWYSVMIFAFGTFAISLSMMPLVEQTGDKNIIVLAIIAGLMNIMIIFATNSFKAAAIWDTSVDVSTEIGAMLGLEVEVVNNAIPLTELCTPQEMNSNSSECRSGTLSPSTYIPSIFDPLASIYNLGSYGMKAMVFVGLVAVAPIVLATMWTSTNIIGNTIIYYLMGIVTLIWQFAIFYKLVMFIINRRGMQ